jgi:uncharacterized membrane protein
MSVLIFFYASASLLLIVLAIPMILGRVKPNGWYGFRIPMTLEQGHIWYPANRYAGFWLLGLGIVLFVASLSLPPLFGLSLDAYAIGMAVLALGGLVVCFLFSWRYARKLARD